jgi:carbonic anhydrase
MLGAALALALAAPLLAQHTWSYEGVTGPDHWASLDPSATLCAAGQRQSPIDLAGAVRNDVPDPFPAYGLRRAHRALAHGRIVLTLDPGSSLEVDGHPWELVQVHAHAPSEHAIDGRRFPVEIHLVHRHASGHLAVLGVLVDAGAENPDLQPLLPPWPAPGAVEPLPALFAAVSLLPTDLATYRYEGSLTTPPCDEGVRWLVAATPITASAAQLRTLADALAGNSRPLQPRHGRDLLLDRP